jgi:hypothetical protein
MVVPQTASGAPIDADLVHSIYAWEVIAYALPVPWAGADWFGMIDTPGGASGAAQHPQPMFLGQRRGQRRQAIMRNRTQNVSPMDAASSVPAFAMFTSLAAEAVFSPWPWPNGDAETQKRTDLPTLRGLLADHWPKFPSSNCKRAFSYAIPNFSVETFKNKAIRTPVYDVSIYGNRTLVDVTGGQVQDSRTLAQFLGTVANASTANWGYDKRSVVVVKHGIFSLPSLQCTGCLSRRVALALHELLHVYWGVSDDAIFGTDVLASSYGLQRVHSGTQDITWWISTDCRYTPQTVPSSGAVE